MKMSNVDLATAVSKPFVPSLVRHLSRQAPWDLGVVAQPPLAAIRTQWIVMGVGRRLTLLANGTGLTSGPLPDAIQNSWKPRITALLCLIVRGLCHEMLRPTLLRSFIVRMRDVYRPGHAGDVLTRGVVAR
ncbi:hypothetical protein [Embleya scabrispora]|uniref:hypothetical protein n=1 Tax=Embleya scabrispora TaxID=159449 RepID=UPI001319C161|nr:hypothetical protein [Embleya scabrispora]MYS86530.1 hypothetical protein [Streptomyces sp. SID5474]